MDILDKSGFFDSDAPKESGDKPTLPNGGGWDEVISPEARQIPRYSGIIAAREFVSSTLREAANITTGLLILGKTALLRMRSRA